eukprot:7214-Heterococcus_DN1.PRE.2
MTRPSHVDTSCRYACAFAGALRTTSRWKTTKYTMAWGWRCDSSASRALLRDGSSQVRLVSAAAAAANDEIALLEQRELKSAIDVQAKNEQALVGAEVSAVGAAAAAGSMGISAQELVAESAP